MSDRVKEPRPPLPVPLDRVLDDGMDELALERTWRRVAATREADVAGGGRWRNGRLKRLVPIGVTVAAAVVAAQPLAEGLGRLFAGEAPVPVEVVQPRVARPPPVNEPVHPVQDPAHAPEPAVAPERGPLAAPADVHEPQAKPARAAVTPPSRRQVRAPGPIVEAAAEEQALVVPTPWAERWRSGDLDGALALLGSEGFAEEIQRNRSVDELFLLADLARVTGRPVEALAALARVGELHPGAPWGGLAAFTAGKLKLEATGDAQGAASAFSRALELGLPEALAAQAVARREEALRRAGGSD